MTSLHRDTEHVCISEALTERDAAIAIATELRRTAVNYFDHHGERCQGDDCYRFATWLRNVREYPHSLCDGCIDEQREIDKEATSKGSRPRGAWSERDDAELVREFSKAVADSKPLLDAV